MYIRGGGWMVENGNRVNPPDHLSRSINKDFGLAADYYRTKTDNSIGQAKRQFLYTVRRCFRDGRDHPTRAMHRGRHRCDRSTHKIHNIYTCHG